MNTQLNETTHIIDKIFDNLDDWRNLPKYQLERRADIFFSIYLQEIFQKVLNEQLRTPIIPEFPLHLRTLGERETDQSVNVDYFAINETGKRGYLIELKTENGSIRKAQDNYLKAAKDKGIYELLNGLKQIYKSTNAKQKYRYLFKQLEKLGFNVETINEGKCKGTELCIIYIKPNNKDSVQSNEQNNIITFDKIIEKVLLDRTDPISARFRKSLAEWNMVKAGEKTDQATYI